mmetsp:Transcript_21182/g.27282  ORF Transcript_21182/g.27282 Transcript_21182/m.27282 type:complete len:317 (+) Transcript_21182:141-1091(+)
MQTLHDNTTSTVTAKKTIQNKIKALDVQRKSLELESGAITDELLAPTYGDDGDVGAPIGIHTPLVDSEGYPRGDIDVYRARHLRHRLSVIQVDYRELMKEMERELSRLSAFSVGNRSCGGVVLDESKARMEKKPKPKFDKKTGKWVVMNWDGSVAGVPGGERRLFHNLEGASDDTASADEEQMKGMTERMSLTERGEGFKKEEEEEVVLYPFASVESVASGSPAEVGGLRVGDLIVRFGSANMSNNRNLKSIAELVPQAAADNQGIDVIVIRPNEKQIITPCELRLEKGVTCKIYPCPWNGRGLLGCHIIPYHHHS